MLKKYSLNFFTKVIVTVLTIFLLSLIWLGSTHKVMTFDPNSYVQIERRELNPSYEVVWILVKPEADLETIRNEVEKTCKKVCDIHMYDAFGAYELDKEYQGLENPRESIKNVWREKFDYLSEHKVGLTNFDVLNIIKHPYKTRY